MSETNKNGAFRKKKIYFSQVSNTALRDKNLSLNAKGLYALISSYITLEDFTLYKDYLISLSSNKKDGFNRAWDELKSNGYLIQYKIKDDAGQYIYEYELLDAPRALSEEDRKAFEKKEANRIARNKRKAENRKAKMNPQVEVPHLEDSQKPTGGISTFGTSSDGNTTPIINTDLNNTDINNIDIKTTTTKKEKKEVVVVDPNVIEQYLNYFGKKPNHATLKKINTYLEHFEVDAITYAFDIAANKGKEFDYVVGILKKWQSQELFTFDAVFEACKL